MGYFDEIIEAAKSNDLIKLYDLARTSDRSLRSSSVDEFTNHLGLTAAGQLALEKNWPAVAVLFDNYKANPEPIIYGAALSELSEQVTSMLLHHTPFEELDVLSRVCQKYLDPEKRSYTKKHPLAPIVRARVVLAKPIDDIATAPLSELCKNGLLEGIFAGAASVNDKSTIDRYLQEFDSQSLSIKEAVELNLNMCEIVKQTIRHAAQGGHLELSLWLIEWYENKQKAQSKYSYSKRDEYFYLVFDGAVQGLQSKFIINYFRNIMSDKSWEASWEERFRAIREFMYMVFHAGVYSSLRETINSLMQLKNSTYAPYFKQAIADIQSQLQAKQLELYPEQKALMVDFRLSARVARTIWSENQTRLRIFNTVDGNPADRWGLSVCFSKATNAALIAWIKQHRTRADFMSACREYVKEYEGSYFFGRSHYERVKSILEIVSEHTDNEQFAALIEQQYQLIHRQEVGTVLGENDAKHNQPVNRRLETDKFSVAVKMCRAKLIEAKSIDKTPIPEDDNDVHFSPGYK